MTTTGFHDRDGFIWMNGKMVPWREANVHFLTHGLHYGTQVFEGERAYNGKIFKSVQHSERLIKSAEIINMESPFSVEDFEKAKYEVLKANNLTNAYVRAALWRGSEQMGIDVRGTKIHAAIAAWDWGAYFDPKVRDTGISLRTSSYCKPAPNSAPTKSKCAGLYVLSTMAKTEAQSHGYTDAFMHDYEGFVAESSGANIFFVKDGTLITPIADRFLNGITRQTVIELAKEAGIPVDERRIKPEEVASMEEVFLTGTAAEITAVGKIDETDYTVGPITKQLRESYETLVRS